MSTHTTDDVAAGVSATRRGLGICVTPLETRRDVILHVARRAEDLGYDGFFLAEGWSQDAAVLLTEIATRTERITIGTGVLSVWGRTAGTLAMLAASLDQVSRGRFVLGLGASSPQLVEGLHDQSFTAPVAKLRAVTAQVRRLLDGERVLPTATHDHRPLRLGVAARTGLPIYLAGLGNKSIQLAGELADGWTPFLVPRSWLPRGIDLLQQAGARSGRTTRPLVCPAVPTAVAADQATAREIASWWIAFYLTSMGSLYRRSLSERGYHHQVEAVVAGNPTHDTTDVPAAAHVLLDELTVWGTPDSSHVEFFVRVMSSASTVALNAGYALALSPADPHGLRSEISFDGAIVVDPVPGNYVVDRAIQASRPLVTIGHLDGVASTIIDNDFETAVRGVLDHFWTNGARRPALVSSPIDASYATRCVAEYERWCAEHHLPAQVVVTKSGLSDESGRLAALDLLAQPEPPDAVFATLHRLALGVVAGAQQSNVDIPQDLMVAGLGDSEAAAHHRIPISSVDLEPTMLGRLAAEALIRRIETHEIPPNRTVPSTLIVRTSSTRSQ